MLQFGDNRHKDRTEVIDSNITDDNPTQQTRVYPKVSGLAAWTENCKWYSSLSLGASCTAILWVSLVSFAAITFCFASQRVFIFVVVYFVIDSVRKLLDSPSYTRTEIRPTGRRRHAERQWAASTIISLLPQGAGSPHSTQTRPVGVRTEQYAISIVNAGKVSLLRVQFLQGVTLKFVA
jgi:hypothetical protein